MSSKEQQFSLLYASHKGLSQCDDQAPYILLTNGRNSSI